MFLLRDLPSRDVLRVFAEKYSEMRVDNVEACLLLLRNASELLQRLEKVFAVHELSQARFLILILLEREPAKRLTAVEIAKKMGVSKPNVTRLINSLENDNLVKRKEHKSDGRASMISITGSGSRQLSFAMPDYYRAMNSAMAGLDQSSKKILIDLLDRLKIRAD